ncbi:MAG: hypothetical protein WDM89_20585 [Rhizomicrobium sp.]
MLRVAGALRHDGREATAHAGAHRARKYDKGYGHFTTRQNIQFNWPRLVDGAGHSGRSCDGRDARDPDQRQLHPQRHRGSFCRSGRR